MEGATMWPMDFPFAWAWMLVSMLLGWGAFIAIIGLVIWAVLRAGGRDRPPAAPPPSDDALSIARRRYATGELTREEYLRTVQDLEQPGRSA
jgi:uncharacterized membrane protein